MLAIGLMAVLGTEGWPWWLTQGPLIVLYALVLVAGSAAGLVRMWTERGDEARVWRAAHRHPIYLLPEPWRRWILDERARKR